MFCYIRFLGSFAEQRKTTLSFVMSVCLSVRVEQLPPTGRIVMKFDIWVIFVNLSLKIQVSLKSDKNGRYFTWKPILHLWTYLAQFLLKCNMFLRQKL